MARVRTFAGIRYAGPDTDLTPLTAPPYDVIDDAQRAELLAGSNHNVVALELPDGPLDPSAPGNRYETGARTWREWREQGVLAQDAQPLLYVLEQRFELAGCEVRRRAFIVEVGLEPFEAGVVLPHERTLPKALGDRYEMIKATAANFSQVFGLFDDPDCTTSELFDAVVAGQPVARATDADGVESVLWASADPAHARRLSDLLADGRIFIADGHHRYTTALAYRDLRRAEGGASAPVDAAFDYVMMALVNMDDPQLSVLPYHRVADADGPFDSDAFYRGLEAAFDVTDLAPSHTATALDWQPRTAFLVKTAGDDHPRLAVLKPEIDPVRAIDAPRSNAWKSLDVAVLQELVLKPLLGIHPDAPETLDRISFTKDADAAFAATGEHDVAFVLRPTRLGQLREVSLGAETMPQKSTYFYPKLLSGLVFRSAE
jgi:uncharacterized protein (DUF1015 family)